MLLQCGERRLDLTQPTVMGILNVTPDSFSDGGKFCRVDDALRHADAMLRQGARIIDVGGESTRPGASPVPEQDERARVVPVITELRRRFSDVIVSIDTRHAGVAQAALDAGADLVNDVTGLSSAAMLAVVQQSRAAVCLMHMQGEPQTMQANPVYADVVRDVTDYLRSRIAGCVDAGIERSRLVIDPGIGFGKRVEHNLALLAHLDELASLGVPLLVGVSRESMFKTLLQRDIEERVHGGVAVACAAVLSGATIIRTHDVAPTLDAIKIAVALRDAGLTVRSAG